MQSDQQQDLQRKGWVEELQVQLSKISEHKKKRLCCFQAPMLAISSFGKKFPYFVVYLFGNLFNKKEVVKYQNSLKKIPCYFFFFFFPINLQS